MLVRLTLQQMITAGSVGLRRHIAAIARSLDHHWSGTESDLFDHHIVGAMGEYAVASVFNLFWHEHVGDIGERDVGGLIDLRTRRPDNGRDLAIRPKDKDGKPILLVHARPPEFALVGWIPSASQGRAIGEWNDRARVHFVPGAVPPLLPVKQLFDLVDAMWLDARHAREAA